MVEKSGRGVVYCHGDADNWAALLLIVAATKRKVKEVKGRRLGLSGWIWGSRMAPQEVRRGAMSLFRADERVERRQAGCEDRDMGVLCLVDVIN